jgi:light-regulated signal transduction histidine kinase (bacteriophytochrome)
MDNNISTLKNIIQSLGLDEKAQGQANRALKKVEKDITRLDFKISRSNKDREIAINLLNKSIKDLESKQSQLTKANELLSKQKAEIEKKNTELLEQKDLVESQSLVLKEHFSKLETSYRELEQFSYIASHDLKSPLRSIAGFAQLLKRRYYNKLDESADEYIDFIVKSTVHMGDVIRDLLEYSKMGKDDDFFEPINTNELINNALSNLKAEIISNKAIINVENLPKLNLYKTGITQVFQNLISNAIKFRTDQQPIINISAVQNNNYWTFTVSDNGIGLDETFREKVFLPFQRIDGNKVKGTGIGLAICKKIVLMHKGEIWYKSTPNKGTTFHFTIYQEAPSSATATTSVASHVYNN